MLQINVRGQVQLSPLGELAGQVTHSSPDFEHSLADEGPYRVGHPPAEPWRNRERIQYLGARVPVEVGRQPVAENHNHSLKGVHQADLLPIFVRTPFVADRDFVESRLALGEFYRQFWFDSEAVAPDRY